MTTGADEGEIAEVGSPVLLPDDPADPADPAARRWATQAIGIATILLAIANASAIDAWFGELPPGRYTEILRAPIAWWSAGTTGWHADVPRAVIRSRWMAAKAARFGREEPGQPGASDAP